MREPRRVERREWPPDQHLGALDTDVDELHRLRARDQSEYDEKIERIEEKIDRLIRTAAAAAVAGVSAAGTLIGNIAWQVFK